MIKHFHLADNRVVEHEETARTFRTWQGTVTKDPHIDWRLVHPNGTTSAIEAPQLVIEVDTGNRYIQFAGEADKIRVLKVTSD